jgi:hypothetical protein
MTFLMLMWSEHDASGGNEGDIAAWAEFDQAARDAGVRVDGAALEPAKTAAAVITPEIAGDRGPRLRPPAPTYGQVEVRPLLEYDLGD